MYEHLETSAVVRTAAEAALDGDYALVDVRYADFAQAFSHWTYEQSCKKLLVADIQGVFEPAHKPTPCFRLTDPVIHDVSRQTDKGWSASETRKDAKAKRERRKKAKGQADAEGTVAPPDRSDNATEHRRGRADRSKSGIMDFFASHQCNNVCMWLRLQDMEGLPASAF